MSTKTTYGSPGIRYQLPPGADQMPDQPFFTRTQVAEIGARVQGVESMRPETISQHVFESREEIPHKGSVRRGKYADDPFPAPDGYLGKAPWWAVSREQEIVEWFKRHPRRQVGDGIGGRKPKATKPAAETMVLSRSGGKVTVKSGTRTELFEDAVLKVAVELRRKYPSDPSGLAGELVKSQGLSAKRARQYAAVVFRMLEADVREQ